MNFIAESDVSNVVVLLNTYQQYSIYAGSIIQDCINFHSLIYLHVRYEANQKYPINIDYNLICGLKRYHLLFMLSGLVIYS